jgi:uncharacterized protein (DUF2384 family)
MNSLPESTNLHEGFQRVVALAEEVFGSQEQAAYWLHSNERQLGNKSPWILLTTLPGQRAVEALLCQMHGTVCV